MIACESKTCKEKIDFSANELGGGNVIPHHWYHQLLRPCGKSDTTAIAILSELIYLCRYNNQREFQLNFDYFARKFNFGLSQVKDAIIRLEEASLVKRDPRTIVVKGWVSPYN